MRLTREQGHALKVALSDWRLPSPAVLAGIDLPDDPRVAALVEAARREENRACEELVRGQRSADASAGNHVGAESLDNAADAIAARREEA